MANGPRFHVLFRRRRSGKTNFYYRKKLIFSNQLRVIVRSSLKNMTIQVAEAQIIGDKILSATRTSELVKDFNWQGNTGNIPASYLTGYLAGKKALKAEVEGGVLDLGIAKASYGNRLFAALKGLVDAGMDIPHNEKIYPTEERIRGEHIAKYADVLSEGVTHSQFQFSLYKKKGFKPQDLPTHFDAVKNAITKKYK